MPRQRASLPSPLAVLPLAALPFTACATGPAWTEPERTELAAVQADVVRVLAVPEAALATDASTPLRDDDHWTHCDLHLHSFHVHRGPVQPDEPFDDREHGFTLALAPTTQAFVTVHADDVSVACAGRELHGFDSIQDGALHPERGFVLLATRRGEQTVATAATTWAGQLWHPTYVPFLSTDGSCFTYVRDNWFRDEVVLAPTADPGAGRTLVYPGVVEWPVYPGRDGSRVRAIVRVGGRFEVRENDRVVATADAFAHPWYDATLDELQVHLRTGDKTRWLFGDRLLPPLDEYRWLRRSEDGAHSAAVGRDGDRDVLLVDGVEVLRAKKFVWLELAASGSTWACSSEEAGTWVVHRPGGIRLGPFPRASQLVLAPDGQQLAIELRDRGTVRWLLDDGSGNVAPLGTEFASIGHVQLLPGRGGAILHARDAAGSWVVTPAGKDGPWDRVHDHPHLLTGDRYAFVARRGDALHRRAVPLR